MWGGVQTLGTSNSVICRKRKDLVMTKKLNVTFQEALEIVEMLPEYQREDLMNIIRNRMIEQRREKLAEHIREAKIEYESGEIKRGTVDDFLMEKYHEFHSS